MKTVLSLCLLLVAFVASAQKIPQCVVIPLPNFTTNVAASSDTNVTAFDNSVGATAAACIQLPGDALDADITMSFYCPTATLATSSTVTLVIGTGPTCDLIGNCAGPGQQAVFVVPATASAANNTNVIVHWKWSNQLTNGAGGVNVSTDTLQGSRGVAPLGPFLRINGITNSTFVAVGDPKVWVGIRCVNQ